jgi:hypothetical protein
MAEQQAIVVGVFEEREAALKAIQALHTADFRDDQLSFAARAEQVQHGGNAIGRGIVGGILGAADVFLAPIAGPSQATTLFEATLPVAEDAIDRFPRRKSQPLTSAPPDAPQSEATTESANEQGKEERASVITGGVVGGVAGAIAALAIPGIGPAVAAGWLASIFGGAAFGSIAGGFFGALMHLGVPRQKAQYYEQELKHGNILVTVKTAERQQQAMEILHQQGAHDVEAH